ncbi:MAG TPA: IS3 family transposase [Gemmatimonadales bacterium]|nr:IS3 family transposase [Gemmatimonadales bacterium]
MPLIASHRQLGVRRCCRALEIAPATYYRAQRPVRARVCATRPPSPRALTAGERAHVLDVLHAPRFVDQAPHAVHAILLDEGHYLCSPRTMYRLLAAEGAQAERRAQRQHPVYAKPELLACAPNTLWSWDITKLRGPVRGIWYALYVVLDVFSRYVVGWRLAARERGELAEELLRWCRTHQGLTESSGLTVHADRGGPMIGKPVSELFVALGITRSHSRPHVPNDNPYSEAQFKTLKYHPTFPDRFGSLEDARAYCVAFFRWYNTVHRHSGIGWHTPVDVHTGVAAARRAERARVLDLAYARHPERFVRQAPVPPVLPTAVWINPPADVLATAGAQ